jgi:Raf kinase inhibitor-like YbhB/YbcL family protein
MNNKKVHKYFIFILGSLFLVLIIGLKSFTQKQNDLQGGNDMELYCKDFKHNESIPQKFTCQGKDVNPQLTWENVPEGTKSFALSVKDPDAPIGTFIHWLVYDIPKDKRAIEENSIPGQQVENHFNQKDYGGPCPPSGEHRYYFRLYALDIETLGKIKNKEEFDKKVQEHTIEKAELMGKYEKK